MNTVIYQAHDDDNTHYQLTIVHLLLSTTSQSLQLNTNLQLLLFTPKSAHTTAYIKFPILQWHEKYIFVKLNETDFYLFCAELCWLCVFLFKNCMVMGKS